jgi:hypothetical protein
MRLTFWTMIFWPVSIRPSLLPRSSVSRRLGAAGELARKRRVVVNPFSLHLFKCGLNDLAIDVDRTTPDCSPNPERIIPKIMGLDYIGQMALSASSPWLKIPIVLFTKVYEFHLGRMASAFDDELLTKADGSTECWMSVTNRAVYLSRFQKLRLTEHS